MLNGGEGTDILTSRISTGDHSPDAKVEILSSLIDITPLKINMEPKNGGLEDDFPFQLGDFQVPC